MLKPTFDWLAALSISKAIGESSLIYPVVQAIHLVFLALLIGGVLAVDLRLLGSGFSSQPLRNVARDARPWIIVGLLGLLVTGIPQLLQNANREYASEFFWWKMQLLPLTLLFTFTLKQRIATAPEGQVSPLTMKLTGLASIAMWTTITVLSRFIGLFT
jgi:hypothetical protein